MQRRRSRLRPGYRTATMQRLQQHPASCTTATRWSTAAKVSAEEEVARPRPRWRSAAACNCVGSRTDLPKPSPICSNSSPMCSLLSELFCCGGSLVSAAADISFATANQSFCVMSDDCKEKVKAREQHQVFKNQIPVVKMRENGLERQRRGRGGRMPESSCRLEREMRQPTVDEEEQDEGRRRRNLHHCSVPLLPSSDEDNWLGSSSSSCTSSDNMVQIPGGTAPGRARRLYTTSEIGMKSTDKIVGWKEAITMKLMKKLEDEEASIDAWMKNKTTKAKMEMKQLERLEKKQEAGMERMQRKIKVAHNKAEKKKDKERKAATQSINAVSTAFEKMMLTGKAPWRLLFV